LPESFFTSPGLFRFDAIAVGAELPRKAMLMMEPGEPVDAVDALEK
jgi:hypothetical protein